VTPLGLVVVIIGLAVAWAIQIYFTARQAKSFQSRVNALRKSGRTAVGRGGSRYRGTVYCALASGDRSTVSAAAVLRGMTVFARPRDVPELVGRPLTELADTKPTSSKDEAVAHAARILLGRKDDSGKGGEPTVAPGQTMSSSSKEVKDGRSR
jgi:glucitol operon activator protein